jgi:hypothetical protein
VLRFIGPQVVFVFSFLIAGLLRLWLLVGDIRSGRLKATL